MKIVLYFSTVLGIFWLIRSALSHNDLVAERNAVQHSNAEDRENEYVFSESANLQDKVLIKSESPLRGRKIHQTAWSKEENDGEKGPASKPSEKKNPELDNSWTLEKLLKYVMSFVYETEETEQQSQIWITEEDIKDKLKQKVNMKSKEAYTKTEKNEDRIYENTQKNGKGSLMFKKGYLDKYQTVNEKQVESDISDESEESDENSYEYEEPRFGEKQVDENQTDYKTNTKKLQSIRTKHTFQNKGYENRHTFTKPDQGRSTQDDEIADSDECFEDTDEDQDQDSREIENEKTTLEENISKSNDMEQSSEELIYKNEQETVKNKKHFVNKGKNMFRNTTENDGHHTSKGHDIVVLNGTRFTGQNVKKDRLETSTTSKSKAELSDSENEKTSKEIFISEHQEIQLDSYTHQEWAQYKSNSSQTATKDEVANSVQNNSDDIGDNHKSSSPTKSKPLKTQQVSKSETKQMASKYETLKNEDMQTIDGQNESLVSTSSIDTTTKSQDLDEDTVTVHKIHPEILVIDNTRHEKIQAIYNEETINNSVDLVATSSNDSSSKTQDINEDTATVLGIQPEILVIDDTRHEKIQAIYNEETINNPVDLVVTSSIDSTTKSQDLKDTATVLEIHPEILAIDDTRQENIQAIYNEEVIINPTEIKPILKNGIEMKNGENKEFNVQKIPNFEILEKHLVEENQQERTENFEGLLQHQTSQSDSRISVAENNLQNYEHVNKNLDNQVNEKPLIFKFKEDDNAYEYILEGNEFIQLNDHNEEQQKGRNYAFNTYESENKSQILTDSIVTMLENVQHADDEQQETFDTILEFLYKRSNNPLILSLQENLSNYTI